MARKRASDQIGPDSGSNIITGKNAGLGANRAWVLAAAVPQSQPPDGLSGLPWLPEALQEPLFRQLWENEADLAFRPYAAAAHSFANCAPGHAAPPLFKDIATADRAKLLDRLSGHNGWKSRLRLLPKVAYTKFDHQTWRALFAVSDDPETRAVLGHMTKITPVLVNQLDHVPKYLRHPGILSVLNDLAVSPEHWQQLRAAIAEAPAPYAQSLTAKAKVISSVGTFWDHFFECIDKPWEEIALPDAFLKSPMLKALRTTEELEREALRMRNCLASRTSQIRAGREAYFSWKGEVPATVQFVHTSGWHMGRILGVQNQPVTLADANQIHLWAEFMLSSVNKDESAPTGSAEENNQAMRKQARELFSVDQLDEVAAVLRDVRGKSQGLGAGTNAYCIFEGKHGYMQFMADVDGREFLCEVQSHHYDSPVQMHLTDEVVGLLVGCGFQWPKAQQNFSRWMTVDGDAGIASLAEFTLGILGRVFGHCQTETLTMKTHIP